MCVNMILVHVCLRMGEQLEKLFRRQHNQLNAMEIMLVEKHKTDVVQRITHVIDCEAYTPKGRTLLREVSVYCIKENRCMSYQIYFPRVDFDEKQSCIRYQIYHVHGLPVREKLDDNFFTYSEVMMMLQMEFIKTADLVAYKGGTIEKNMLASMGVKGINIEIIGCDKYANLLTKYGISSRMLPL